MIIIADTSPLISLILIARLDILEKLKPLFELLLKNSRYYSEKLFNFFLETANESLF